MVIEFGSQIKFSNILLGPIVIIKSVSFTIFSLWTLTELAWFTTIHYFRQHDYSVYKFETFRDLLYNRVQKINKDIPQYNASITIFNNMIVVSISLKTFQNLLDLAIWIKEKVSVWPFSFTYNEKQIIT